MTEGKCNKRKLYFEKNIVPYMFSDDTIIESDPSYLEVTEGGAAIKKKKYVILESYIDKRDLLLRHKYNREKVLFFIATKDSTSFEDGTPYQPTIR